MSSLKAGTSSKSLNVYFDNGLGGKGSGEEVKERKETLDGSVRALSELPKTERFTYFLSEKGHESGWAQGSESRLRKPVFG